MLPSALPVESGDALLQQTPALLSMRGCSRLSKRRRTLQQAVPRPSAWVATPRCLLLYVSPRSMSSLSLFVECLTTALQEKRYIMLAVLLGRP